MSTTVTYKGDTLTTVNNNTKTLKTAGKYMEGDVTLVDVTEVYNGGGAKLGKLICTLSAKELGGPPPYGWLFTTNAKPVVGGFPNAQALQFVSLSLGSNIVAYNKLWPDSSDGTPITSPVIASGLTVSGYIFDDGLRFDSGIVELYRCNFDFSGFTSVSEFTDFTFENGLLTLVVPELDQSECLAIYFRHQ